MESDYHNDTLVDLGEYWGGIIAFVEIPENYQSQIGSSFSLVELPSKFYKDKGDDVCPNNLEWFFLSGIKRDNFDHTPEPQGVFQSRLEDYVQNMFLGKSNVFEHVGNEDNDSYISNLVEWCLKFLTEQVIQPTLDKRYVFVSVLCSTIVETYSFNAKDPIMNALIKFYAKSAGMIASNFLYQIENLVAGVGNGEISFNDVLPIQAVIAFASKGISKVAFIELGVGKDNLVMKTISTFISGVSPNFLLEGQMGGDKVQEKFRYSSFSEFLKLGIKSCVPAKGILSRSAWYTAAKILAKEASKFDFCERIISIE